MLLALRSYSLIPLLIIFADALGSAHAYAVSPADMIMSLYISWVAQGFRGDWRERVWACRV